MAIFKAVKVSESVYWVGAIDWNIREFHGYTTHHGSTYNAYLILADKPTLIDTVKAPFKSELLERISSVINPKDIAYIVSNHTEMDHSGCLSEIIQAVQPEKVFASVMGAKALKQHFTLPQEIIPLKTGDELSLGNKTLAFTETRMLHWPDSMFSYLKEERLLFSQDGFGMHLASEERFADELDKGVLDYEFATYFANILLPYTNLITALLDKIKSAGPAIDIIAPDHGPIWRRDLTLILDKYRTWSEQKPTRKAVVLYDTMWHSTERMARAVEEGLHEGGAQVKVMSMAAVHRSDIAYEILDAGALVVGSPTLNNNIFPTMADVLTYLKGLRPKNLVGAAFGSYGWSGESASQLQDILKEMKVEIVTEPVKSQYVPNEGVLAQCHDLGLKVANRLKEVAV